jgi:hypothetical protein
MINDESIKAVKEIELIKKKIMNLEKNLIALDQYFYPQINNPFKSSLCSQYDSILKELNERQRLLINLRRVPSNSGFSRNIDQETIST